MHEIYNCFKEYMYEIVPTNHTIQPVYVGVVCKTIKKEKSFISHWKKTRVYKCEFLLCSKLCKSYDGWALIVGFLILLYGYL